MSLSLVQRRALLGLKAQTVIMEVHLANGLPSFMLVGLADVKVKETRERVRRASIVGVYRLWRDLGYAIGALLSGLVADFFGVSSAMWVVAAMTAVSGGVVLVRMKETRR